MAGSAAGPRHGSLRLGFSDLNAEFYSNEAAGLLLAPAFGIGSELAATGPNGPAIFPSTALTARLRLEPGRNSYVQGAVVNAEAGVLGDHGGIRPLFGKGALLIAEIGTTGPVRLAAGLWRYTRRQENIRPRDTAGDPLRRRARGGYALAEVPLRTDEARPVTAFIRPIWLLPGTWARYSPRVPSS